MTVEVGVGGDGIDAVINSPWWQPACFGEQLPSFGKQFSFFSYTVEPVMVE